MSEEKIGQHYLAALHQAFPGVVLDEAWQTKDQLTITVKVNYLPEVVEFLYYQQGGWLSVLFGNDERKLNGHYAVYYVLSMEQGTKCWITVRVEVDANKPEYPSVTPRVPAAVWGEREVRDMYGLVPVGLPDERRLVLPDDWPDELYPLRKDSMDYRQRPAPTTDAETYEFINELGSKKNNVVPIGPLHVTSDEPGHFRLFVDGENIIDADYRLFYVHRGMEKLAETRMGYNEVTFLSDRVCGICGFAHSTAYTTSVENAMGIVVPERAQMIRAILLEDCGLTEQQADDILAFISIKGTNAEVLAALENYAGRNETFDTGLGELKVVASNLAAFGMPEENFVVDLTIARGLDYYTGTVYETLLLDHPELGSVCSGGRYDNLAGYYIEKQLPGVGISIGLTRLFYVLDEQGLLNPELPSAPADALVLPMGDIAPAIALAETLRSSGLRVQLYCEQKKFKQKIAYADKLKVPFAVLLGEDEIAEGKCSVKNMKTGEQLKLTPAEAAEHIKASLDAETGTLILEK